MPSLLLFLVACFGIWKTGQYVCAFIEEQWLLEPQRHELQARFEGWWFSVAGMKPRAFAMALAKACSELMGSFFGERLFSKRAFKRSAATATFLLLSSLVVTEVRGDV